jgi:hypothetical protein
MKPKGAKNITNATKKKVLTALVKNDRSKEQIAKSHKISYYSLLRIMSENRDLYEDIKQKLQEKMRLQASFIADKCVKRIKKDKIDDSSALQLSQTAKNLTTLYSDNSTQIAINVNIPQNKDDLVDFVMNAKSLEFPKKVLNIEDVVESANMIDDNDDHNNKDVNNINNTFNNE